MNMTTTLSTLNIILMEHYFDGKNKSARLHKHFYKINKAELSEIGNTKILQATRALHQS